MRYHVMDMDTNQVVQVIIVVNTAHNYRDGYAAGWAASTNANSNGQQHMNPPPTQQRTAQSTPDWTLTVNVVGVPFLGKSFSLIFKVRGPSW